MPFVASLNTAYSSLTFAPALPEYGQLVAIIGTSTKGPYMQPTFIRNLAEAEGVFGSGELVEAFEEVFLAGTRHIYLVRINMDGEDTIETPYDRLAEALDILKSCMPHIVVPVGFYFDDADDYVALLVSFCEEMEPSGGCVVTMSTKPLDLTQEPLGSAVKRLYHYERARKDYGAASRCLSVVASEVGMFVGTPKYRVKPGAAVYAGLLSTILPGYSPVNKSLTGIQELKYDFKINESMTDRLLLSTSPVILSRRPLNDVQVASAADPSRIYLALYDYEVDYDTGEIWATPNTAITGPVDVSYRYSDLDTLASCGYVTFTNFVRAGIAPSTSVTMSKGPNRWHISDTRVMQDISWSVRDLCDSLIGESAIQSAKLGADIAKYLDYLVATHQIYSDYSVDLEQSLSDLLVYIGVRPMQSALNIDITIRLPLIK